MSRVVKIDFQFEGIQQGRDQYDALLEYITSHQPTINGTPLGNLFTPQEAERAQTFGGLETGELPGVSMYPPTEQTHPQNRPSNPILDAQEIGRTIAEAIVHPKDLLSASPQTSDTIDARRNDISERISSAQGQTRAFEIGAERPEEMLSGVASASSDKAVKAVVDDFLRSNKRARTSPKSDKSDTEESTSPDDDEEEKKPHYSKARRFFHRNITGIGAHGSWVNEGEEEDEGALSKVVNGIYRNYGLYVGAQTISAGVDQTLTQRAQYNKSIATAGSANDVISAEIAYQDNSWEAQFAPLGIPVGHIGSGIREAWTHDKAYIAGVQKNTQMGEQNAAIIQQTFQSKLHDRAAESIASGTFSGQQKAIDDERVAAIEAAKNNSSIQITDLSSASRALDASDPSMAATKGSIIWKKDELTAQQIQDVKNQTEESIRHANADADLKTAANVRHESAADIGSTFEVKSLNEEFNDTRQASRDRIEGPSRKGIADTNDPEAKKRIRDVMDAALKNEGSQYVRETGYEHTQNQAGAFGLQSTLFADTHQTNAAALAGIQAKRISAGLEYSESTDTLNKSDPDQLARFNEAGDKYAQAMAGFAADANRIRADFVQQQSTMTAQTTASLQAILGNNTAASQTSSRADYLQQLHDNPEMSKQIGEKYGVTQYGNEIASQQRNFGIDMTTTQIEQQGNQQDLRNKRLDLSADVQGVIDSSANQIAEAKQELGRSSEHAPQLQERIKKIEGTAQSNIQGLIGPNALYGRAQQVSAWMLGPNIGTALDIATAMKEGAGAAGVLNAAANNPLPYAPYDIFAGLRQHTIGAGQRTGVTPFDGLTPTEHPTGQLRVGVSSLYGKEDQSMPKYTPQVGIKPSSQSEAGKIKGYELQEQLAPINQVLGQMLPLLQHMAGN